MTYHVWVKCVSSERFDVEASSEKEAREKYERGDCTLEQDEVQDREITNITPSHAAIAMAHAKGGAR